jgi:Ricin-type beta-trefoil lectin domain-like
MIRRAFGGITGGPAGRRMRTIAAVVPVVAGAVAIATVVPASAEPESVTIVTPAGNCLDVKGASVANGAPVIVWQCNRQANQSWLVTSRKTDDYGQSWFEIRNRHSDMCLDVQQKSTEPEAKLIQYQCNGGDNQLFLLSEDSTKGRVIRARHSGLCLDIYQELDQPGTQLQQFGCNGGPNQRFVLRSDASPVPTPAPEDTQPPADTTQPPVGEVRVLFYRVSNLWLVRTRATFVRRLAIRGLPNRTVVTVRCRGGGCPFSHRTRRARNGRVNLHRAFHGRRLTPGTVVRLVLEMPGFGTYEVRFKMRARSLPRRTDYCPGRRSTKLRRCG